MTSVVDVRPSCRSCRHFKPLGSSRVTRDQPRPCHFGPFQVTKSLARSTNFHSTLHLWVQNPLICERFSVVGINRTCLCMVFGSPPPKKNLYKQNPIFFLPGNTHSSWVKSSLTRGVIHAFRELIFSILDTTRQLGWVTLMQWMIGGFFGWGAEPLEQCGTFLKVSRCNSFRCFCSFFVA